jgi:uncharacterized lipoprotein YmbA
MTHFKQFAALAALLLASCSSPDPTLYALQAVPGTPVSAPAQVIEVRRPGLAGYLDRPSIITGAPGYQIDLSHNTRWAEPLGDMIGRVLVEDLAARLRGSTVFGEGGAIGGDATLRVELDVQHFDPGPDGIVRLAGAVVIERNHSIVHSAQLDLRSNEPTTGPAGIAGAMSALLGEVADRVARDVAGLPAAVAEGK